MKPTQLIALGALALLASHGASAQTVIRIVGSNGDRSATQTAISNILAPGWTFQGINGSASAANLSVATGANYGAWNGSYAGNALVIKVSFSGALAGIAAVAGNTDQRFVVSTGTGSGAIVDPSSSAAVLGSDYEINKADFGFSTNFQATSPFNGVYQGVTYSPVTEEIVGVSPLGFYASPGFPATGANITTQLAQLLYTSGAVPLALFTGDFANDANKIVYAIGRNTDAGQRYGAYTEIGLGTTTTVRVWQPTYLTPQTTASGVTYGGVVGTQDLWPAETLNGIYSPQGSGGYSTGALLAAALTTTLGSDAYKGKYLDPDTQTYQYLYPNATAGYYIGYVTPSDANSRVIGGNVPVANRGIALSYNGVALTNPNIQNGRYTAWVYNRILKPQSGLTGLQLTVANALRDRITNFDATAGGGLKNDAAFLVKRSTDGGLVTPK